MKIMKIVYMQECEHSNWDGSNSQKYMGEESWQVGEKFNGEFIQGVVSSITDGSRDYGYTIWVIKDVKSPQVEALLIPIHAVQRVYYGEE